MTKYDVVFSGQADKDLDVWRRSGAKKDVRKIFKLIEELETHPRTGTGQVEALKENLSGLWSRRINKHYRMLYSIQDEIVTVELLSLRGHYADK